MGIFDFFKPSDDELEKSFYEKFKTDLSKTFEKEITVSVLRTRVLTIQETIKRFNKGYGITEHVTGGVFCEKKPYKEYKMKINVLSKIELELKEDFIRGVKIQYEDLDQTEIPSDYDKCVLFTMRLESKYWKMGRYIAMEKIKKF